MKVINVTADFNSVIPGTDRHALVIVATLEDKSQKYLKLNKPFTKKEFAAALHYFGSREFSND